jgi:hypothetical protein
MLRVNIKFRKVSGDRSSIYLEIDERGILYFIKQLSKLCRYGANVPQHYWNFSNFPKGYLDGSSDRWLKNTNVPDFHAKSLIFPH